jgi:tol-pal system protein YbgF
MRTRLLTATVMLWLALAGTPAAQNRAELQMNADLRILQEQVSRLQLATNQLAEQLKIINKRLDDQASSNQKQAADARLLIINLANTVNTVREKVDDNTVRVSQLGQELPAIRSGLGMVATQLNTLVGLLQPPVNPTDPNAPPGSAPGQIGTVQLPDSPTAIFQAAMNDYTANRLPLAIEGFTQYVNDYPSSPNAADAQFWIGMAYFYDKKSKEALEAFGKVVRDYKGSDKVPEAMLQQGLTYLQMGQRPAAIKIFNQIVKEFPGTTSAILAQQRLAPASR